LDLNATLSRLEKRLRRVLPPNVELALKKSGALTELPPQRLPLDAIVMSLVRKSAEAMPEGGVVTVSTANHEMAGSDPHEMQAVAPARYVTLSVAESSGAVDADALSRAFDSPAGEPSPAVDAEGGLPLATVYRLLQRVGGDLSVEVEPGRGSRFVVFLPLEAETQRPAAAGRSETGPAVSAPGH
jgi:signal transduction histidine kinase